MRKLNPVETFLLSIFTAACFFSAFGIVVVYMFPALLSPQQAPIPPVYWCCIPLFIISFVLFEILEEYGYKEPPKQ